MTEEITKEGEESPLDFAKSVQTRAGDLVRVFTTKGPNPKYPVVGSIEGDGSVHQWTLDGSHTEEYLHDLEYTPIREKYYVTVSLHGSEESDAVGELEMFPGTMAQIIVDPKNKVVKIQGFHGTKIEGIPKHVVPAQPSGDLVSNFMKGNKVSPNRSVLQQIEDTLGVLDV